MIDVTFLWSSVMQGNRLAIFFIVPQCVKRRENLRWLGETLEGTIYLNVLCMTLIWTLRFRIKIN